MNKIIFILASVFILTASGAQTPVLSLSDDEWGVTGAYYKDINDDLDHFVGTWKWVNGDDSFEIVLAKREQVFFPVDNLYKDMLIGGYKYTENGIEVINTIPSIANTYSNPYKYTISGTLIIDNNHNPPCTYCLPGEKRVKLHMDDPQREYIPVTITLRHYGGEISLPGQDPPEFIHMIMRGDHAILPTETSPTWIRVPRQEYTLEKQ